MQYFLKGIEPRCISIAIANGMVCRINDLMTFSPGSVIAKYSFVLEAPLALEPQV